MLVGSGDAIADWVIDASCHPKAVTIESGETGPPVRLALDTSESQLSTCRFTVPAVSPFRLSRTETFSGKDPVVRGVPEIVPAGLNSRPLGKDPADQVNGGTPFSTVSWYEYSFPAFPGGRGEVPMEG
jgi:hypothetical protein